MAKKETYTVETDVEVSTADAFGERFDRKWKAGEIVPKSEQDEYALALLVQLGIAKTKAAPAAKEKE